MTDSNTKRYIWDPEGLDPEPKRAPKLYSSSSEIIVRSYTRRRPKVQNKKLRVKTERRLPPTDVSTVRLINSMVHESFKDHSDKNPSPEISKASDAWQQLWASGKRRRKPQYRSVAKAKKREKEIQKKKQTARDAFNDIRKPYVRILNDPDIYLDGEVYTI